PMLEGGYGSFCGTSSATPVVSGLAALAVAANPHATAEEIEQALERPAVAMAGFVRYGRIDAPRTLSLLAPAVQAERAATTALIKGSLTPTAPSRTYVRATAGGRLTATLTFRSTGRLSLSLTPQQPPGPTTRVTGGGQLRLKRTLHAGTVRFVVRGRRDRLELDFGHVAPELLELVEPARLGREHVQDDVEVVREDPRPFLRPVGGARDQALLLLQLSVDLVPDRNCLAWVAARGDHEVVGEITDRPHVEDHDVLRQLLLGESGDAAGLFERIQGWISVL